MAGQSKQQRWPRPLRIFGWVVFFLVVLVLTAPLALLRTLETPAAKGAVKRLLVDLLQTSVPGLEVEHLGGKLPWRPVIGGLVLRDDKGEVALRIAMVQIVLDPAALLAGEIHLERLLIIAPEVLAYPLPGQDQLNLATLIKQQQQPPPPQPEEESQLELAVDELQLFAGQLTYRPAAGPSLVVRQLSLEGGLTINGPAVRAQLAQLRLKAHRQELQASISARGELALAAESLAGQLQLELAGLVPGKQPIALDIDLSGSPTRPELSLTADLPGPQAARIEGWAELPSAASPLRYALTAHLEQINPGSLLASLPQAELNAALEAQGRGLPLEPDSSSQLRVQLQRSRLAQIPLERLLLRAQTQGERWRISEAQAAVPGLQASLEASGTLERLTAQLRAELEGGRPLPPALGGLAGAGTLSASVAGPFRGPLEARASLSARRLRLGDVEVQQLSLDLDATGLPDDPQGTLTLSARKVRPGAGAVPLRRVALKASGGPQRWQISARGSGRGVAARLEGVVRQSGKTVHAKISQARIRHPQLRAALRGKTNVSYEPGRFLKLSPTRIALLGGQLRVAGFVRWQGSERANLELVARRLRLPRWGRVSAQAELKLTSRRLRVSATARPGAGKLDLQATLPVRTQPGALMPALRRRGPLTLQLEAEDLPLGKLASLTGRELDLDGLLDLGVDISGNIADPEAVVAVQVDSGRLGQKRGLSLKLDSAIKEGKTRIDLDFDQRGRRLVELRGYLDLGLRQLQHLDRAPNVPLQLSLATSQLDLADLPGVEPGQLGPYQQLRLELTVQNTLYRPSLALTFALREKRPHPRAPASAPLVEGELQLDSKQQSTALTGTVTVQKVPFLELSGQLDTVVAQLLGSRDLRRVPWQARLEVPIFPLRVITRWLPGLSGVRGTLQGEAQATGTLAGLESGDLQLRATDLRVKQLPLDQAQVNVSYSAPRLRAVVRLGTEEQPALLASATLQDGQLSQLTGRFKVEDFPLDLVEPLVPQLRELGGQLTADLQAKLADGVPQLAGTLAIKEAKVGLLGYPTFSGIEAHLDFSSERIQLAKLAVPIGEGTIEAAGALRLQRPLGGALQLELRANQVPLQPLGIKGAKLNTKLAISGNLSPQRFEGQVTIQQGKIELAELPSSTRDLGPLGKPPEVRFVPDLASYRAQSPEQIIAEEDESQLDLQLAIKSTSSIFVRGKDVNIELGLDLLAQNQEEGVALTGEITIYDGFLRLLDRRYDIERSRISFNNKSPPNPALNLRLTHQFDEALAIIKLLGTIANPELELASEPPIYDRAQVFNLILTGQPGVTNARSGGGLSMASVLLQRVVGRLADKIAPGVGLDVVRISQDRDTSAQGTEQQTQIEVGKYLTDRLYMGYRRILGALEDENSNEGLLEYQISPRWSLETIFGDAGVGGMDVFWTYWY